jgi:hypothetical protein
MTAWALLSAACAQGDLQTGGSFGMTSPATMAGDDDDGTGDDDGSTGTAGETSGASTTGGLDDGTTSAVDSSGESSGAPVTASADESSSMGSGLVESSSSAASSEAGDDMAEAGDEVTSSGDDMPMEDDGAVPPEPWESCEAMACDAGSLCINVTGLRGFSPYCAPECMVDADCPYPGGDALVSCALIEDGATEPTHCAVICEYDDMVLGECPDGMQCAEVPDQMTQVALCMWP